MKASQVTNEMLANYLRLDEPEQTELEEISRFKASALAYIEAYTGLNKAEIDEYEDITQALFILVADYFDNRNLYLEGKSSTINRAVDSILAIHSINLL